MIDEARQIQILKISTIILLTCITLLATYEIGQKTLCKQNNGIYTQNQTTKKCIIPYNTNITICRIGDKLYTHDIDQQIRPEINPEINTTWHTTTK